MTGGEVVMLVVVYSVLAVIAHEGTHWLAAEVYGRDPSIDWAAVECAWRAPEDTSGRERAQDALIRCMPVLVGVAFAPVALAPLTDSAAAQDLIRAWAWVIYTVPIPVPVVGGIGASIGDWLGLVALARRGGEAV